MSRPFVSGIRESMYQVMCRTCFTHGPMEVDEKDAVEKWNGLEVCHSDRACLEVNTDD